MIAGLPGGAGVLVISLDTELAWGTMHRGSYDGREQDFGRTRFVIEQLLYLFERYRVQATWAIVGHLFLDGCSPVGGVKHPEIVRPDYPWLRSEWLERDPATDVARDPWWYGPDIVRKIAACPVAQEIACHNFTHAIVGERGYSREAFASELRACRGVAEEWGVDLKSFVFPRNSVGHLDVLAEAGFTSFRGVTTAWTSTLPGPVRRPARLMDAFLPAGSPVAMPVRQAGMWNIPATYQFLHGTGWARAVPAQTRVQKAVRAMREAASKGAVFHMWTHPFNVASDPVRLLRVFEDILQEGALLRESGLLVNHTMGSLAAVLEQQRVKGEGPHREGEGSGESSSPPVGEGRKQDNLTNGRNVNGSLPRGEPMKRSPLPEGEGLREGQRTKDVEGKTGVKA